MYDFLSIHFVSTYFHPLSLLGTRFCGTFGPLGWAANCAAAVGRIVLLMRFGSAPVPVAWFPSLK